MRKEVILAVLIGVILGGVILYGINLANNTTTSSPKNEEIVNNQPDQVPSSEQNAANQVTFIYPLDHSVITEDKITLKGTTKPNANVAIITESDDIITNADANGNFSSPINLISGENAISVTSVDTNFASSSAAITVIHSTNIPE